MTRAITPIPLVSGTLFGAGLAVGGMTDPARVRGFLDVFGRWDSTLVFVMAAAVAIMALTWRVQRGMINPRFAKEWHLPERRNIDWRLLAGSIIFGLGWGIAGLCPGPAIAILGVQPLDLVPFVAAMLVGMLMYRIAFERTKG